MDAGGVDQVDDGVVALLILITQILSQIDQQLPADRFIAMHVPNVLKFRLTYDTHTKYVQFYIRIYVCVIYIYIHIYKCHMNEFHGNTLSTGMSPKQLYGITNDKTHFKWDSNE